LAKASGTGGCSVLSLKGGSLSSLGIRSRTTQIAPALNERDIEDIPEHLRHDLELVFVEEIGEVLSVALEPQPSANGRRRSRAAAQSRV